MILVNQVIKGRLAGKNWSNTISRFVEIFLLLFYMIFQIMVSTFYSFLASREFGHPLIAFSNSLDPDQGWKSMGPDLDSNCLTLWYCSWKNFLKS